jgi:hypothetical protein
MRKMLCLAVAGLCLAAAAPRPASAITDDDVLRAIERAKEWLVNEDKNGTWPQEEGAYPGGRSAMALYTLAYAGEHPNRPVISVALDAAIARPSDKTYVRAMRTLALAIIQNKLADPKRAVVRQALVADAQWLVNAQGSHGGWNYDTLRGGTARFDLSNTQLAILALWQASLAGVEIPEIVWQRTQKLYYQLQQSDGSWNYGDPGNRDLGGSSHGYGSMTAAGLASIYIIADMLDLASGCPCRDGKSGSTQAELNRRIDQALGWLSKNFRADGNPTRPGYHNYYWLYSAERVGIAAGYKYFGTHNWYREGAEFLIKEQMPNGSWHGNVVDTCFALLFLYKGRAPVLYQKLQVPGAEWNSHRRDISNLTGWIERQKEQQFHWQIVSLVASVEELHEAPILYLSLETAPQFSAEDKKKLRAFTDTGGTIVVEPSCGAPAVQEWFAAFAKEVWPEWPVAALGPDHGTFLDPYPLKPRPEIKGIHDGVRTFLFYALDDLSCPWQTKAVVVKEYLFKWGINLFTYATDHSPLRAKLAAEPKPQAERYAGPAKGGGKAALTLARLKTASDWTTGRNYKGLDRIAADLAKRATVGLKVEEDGTNADMLAGKDVAFLTGSVEVSFGPGQAQALKAWLGKDGFLWAEAAVGSPAFDQSFRKLAADLGWELKLMDKASPIMTGAFAKAVGFNLTADVQFRRVLKVLRGGRPWAEFWGIYQDKKLVGYYSPFDTVFACTAYDAFGCRGYQVEDALAVALNILLAATDK